MITSSDMQTNLDGSSHHFSNNNAPARNARRPMQQDDQLALNSRQAYHKAKPSLAELANDTPRVEDDDEEAVVEKKPKVVKVERVDDGNNDSDEGRTESEKKRKKRENSFIRDGYEVYFEGTYIVNGRRKKKIKKRKLSK